MSNAVQYTLFKPTIQQRFAEWVHTAQGREVADTFIRLSIGCHRRGIKVGARAIWERRPGLRKPPTTKIAPRCDGWRTW